MPIPDVSGWLHDVRDVPADYRRAGLPERQADDILEDLGSASGSETPTPRCGATIEVEWPGHTAVLSRRSCKAYPLKGFDHCRYHLTVAERARQNGAERVSAERTT